MAIAYSDMVLFLSHRNQNDAKRLYGDAKKSGIVSVYIEDRFNEELNFEASKKPIAKYNLKLLFVGSSTPHNAVGVKWFIKKVLPFVDATLIIVGSVTHQLKFKQNQKKLVIKGSVKNISQYYYEADIVVCPLLSGEGMKVKVVEALMFGKTIFGSSEAFSGYDLEFGKVGTICNNSSDYINAIKHFSATETNRYNLNSRKAFLERFTAEKYYNEMKNCLNLSYTDRVGLVGLNGTGKTTLLKFLSEQKDAHIDSEGSILRPNDMTIGYLPQELTIDEHSDVSAIDFVIHDAVLIGKELEELAVKLSENTEDEDYDAVLQKYGELNEHYERIGGYSIKNDAEKILSGLGFHEDDLLKSIWKFSGGWQMRLFMARLLLQKPSMLFLDEPTNHLDMDALLWLEEYLLSYEGGIVVISHDRFFLDRICNRTLEISMKTISDYKGGYSYYEQEKIVRFEQSVAIYQKKQKEIEHLQKFVDRFRYKATKARQAQSRLKTIEKIQEGLETPEQDLSKISFTFPKATRSGEIVLTFKDISKSFTTSTGEIIKPLNKVSGEIVRGDFIAVVGHNGAGKSTLCNILSNTMPAEGLRKEGHNVIINFYTQHQADALKGDLSVLDEVLSSTEDIAVQQKARDILGSFLFSGEAVKKKVKVLSGGEKARLAMAKLLMQTANFLILDEPTNHLDMRSKEVLIEALECYEGTVLLVSHDRYFLDALATKVWEINHGTLIEHLYSYTEYMEKKFKAKSLALASEKIGSHGSKSNDVLTKSALDIKSVNLTQVKSSKNSKNSKNINRIEKEISIVEQEIKKIETVMLENGFYSNREQATQIEKKYRDLKEKVDELYKQWENEVATI
ncbi:hypothetical protein CHS0354_023984 [Potamilus streckersoni]|uniref:ABC transporter domain-containing protein n=1 Tax=Potamilus streckersoni TaxID=2493646 RepID=A0AAE0RZI7_9BIVA|nr:hypothetical protein CHS0354_023984 [Potamilus streckersoni]